MTALRASTCGLRPAIAITLGLVAARLATSSPAAEPPVMEIPEVDAGTSLEVPYRMHHSDDDPRCARLRAIAYARVAGILGPPRPYQTNPDDLAALVHAGCPLSSEDVETLLPLPLVPRPLVGLINLTSDVSWNACSDSF